QAFSSVTSILNMAVFRGHFVLEDLVEEMKRQSTGLSFGALQPNGHIAVQGSFPAIQGLRDLLLLKAKSLPEKDKRKEGKSPQKPRRRLQGHGSTTETRNSPREQVVVLDTDIYHYMRQFFPWIFQVKGVVISDVTDGDVTTVCVESAGGADAEQVSNVKQRIEERSLKLHQTLRKERIHFQGLSRDEKQRYRKVCEKLKPHYPHVLVIPHEPHMDIIGFPSEVLEFTRKVVG
ncbi:RBM43 protein, partial [Neodrepanis coruscans]|nr:RBM43 protein [Neodrepanis coruscans]